MSIRQVPEQAVHAPEPVPARIWVFLVHAGTHEAGAPIISAKRGTLSHVLFVFLHEAALVPAP